MLHNHDEFYSTKKMLTLIGINSIVYKELGQLRKICKEVILMFIYKRVHNVTAYKTSIVVLPLELNC